MPLLGAKKEQRDAPPIICIHAGGNDLGYKGTELRSSGVIIDDISVPGVSYVFFFNLCERRVWMRGTCGAPGGLNRTRRNINKVVDSFPL